MGQIWNNRKRLREKIIVMVMNPRKDDRLALPALGEYYDDLLLIDAWINNRSKVVQGQSLLCAKLQERETKIKERVEYLAKKRGVSFDEMWLSIISNKAQRMTPNELSETIEYKPGEEG